MLKLIPILTFLAAATFVLNVSADPRTGYTLSATPSRQHVDRGQPIVIELSALNSTATDSAYCIVDEAVNGADWGYIPWNVIPAGLTAGTTNLSIATDTLPRSVRIDLTLVCGGTSLDSARVNALVDG
jgi:hypothetical protein